MADTVEASFDEMRGKLAPDKFEGVTATYQFNVTGDGGGEWNLDITDGQPKLERGSAANPDLTITTAVEDWLAVVNGEMTAQTAFLTGKVQIDGDYTLALKLQDLL